MTTSDNLSERIRFEAWAAPRGADTTYDSDNGYVNPDTAIAFSAWQARAAQLEAELSDLRRQLAEATKENNNSWLALLKEHGGTEIMKCHQCTKPLNCLYSQSDQRT